MFQSNNFLESLSCEINTELFLCSEFQCVLPTGVEFYSSGFDSNDVLTFPWSYPIILIGICFASQIFSYKYLELINLKGFWPLYCNSLYFRWDCPLFALIKKFNYTWHCFFLQVGKDNSTVEIQYCWVVWGSLVGS